MAKKKKQHKGEVKGIVVPRQKHKTFEKLQERQAKRQKQDVNQIAARIVREATREK
jgi:hypothetical protein